MRFASFVGQQPPPVGVIGIFIFFNFFFGSVVRFSEETQKQRSRDVVDVTVETWAVGLTREDNEVIIILLKRRCSRNTNALNFKRVDFPVIANPSPPHRFMTHF